MLAVLGKVSVGPISNSRVSCFSLFRINRLVEAKGHSTDTEQTPSQLSIITQTPKVCCPSKSQLLCGNCQNAQISLQHSKSAHK